MQFKTKLLLTRIIIFVLLMMLMFLSYKVAVSQYSKQMDNDITREIAIKQQNIANIISLTMVNRKENTSFYRQVHRQALKYYIEHPELSLTEIKSKLSQEFAIPNKNIDIFLINPDKIIYKATLKEDIGFNLSKFTNPSEMIDNAFANSGIHISPEVSQDVLDGSYKTYSYAKASENIILEMSFIDYSASQIFRIAQQQDSISHMKATLYTIFNEKNEYYYFNADNTLLYKNKQEAYAQAPRFDDLNYKDDSVLTAFLTGDAISFEDKDEGVYFYYANLLAEPLHDTEFENIVVKYEVSLQEKEQFLKSIQQFFVVICSIVLLAMWGIHLLVKNQLVKPIGIITSYIRERGLIPIDRLNNRSDEFYIIAKEYNKVYSELNKEIERNASKVYIDSLTQAGNRQAFDEELESLILAFEKKQRHFAIMLFDIDHFKTINDNYGHLVGDKVLKEVSVLVKNIIRDRDSLYRVGGEEFVIFLTDTALDDAIEVAERVRKEIALHFVDWETGAVTISAGICQMTQGNTYESLYRCVDNMLYKAKSDGKNRVCYDLNCIKK